VTQGIPSKSSVLAVAGESRLYSHMVEETHSHFQSSPWREPLQHWENLDARLLPMSKAFASYRLQEVS